MFKKLFTRPADAFRETEQQTVIDEELQDRMQKTEGSNSAELAAVLLAAPAAMMRLTLDEARIVVSFMEPRKFPVGTIFIQEGDKNNTDYMVLVLDGEVTVESITVSRTTPVTTAVLGSGSILGEMGIVDGEPRSATCTATSNVRAAIFTRESLEQLITQHPSIGAKFMMSVALRIAQRLRDTADKLKLYTQLTQAMQQEIDRLMPT
ncbi:MAG: cyclic nucleotide-binding domain-containing protein [Burkholderiales bacterium]|nr:MAG: cyclic nucleotide-binding domain-containing protein [Burkholderiales bacterium]